MIVSQEIHQFLETVPFFTGLAEEDVLHLSRAARLRVVSANTVLFLQGDKVDAFFIILNGWIKLFRQVPEGEEAVLALLTRGDSFGEGAGLLANEQLFSAETAEQTELVEIPGRAIREMALSEPEVLSRVMKALYDRIKYLQIEGEHMALMDAPQRIACLLLRLSKHMIGRGGTFVFPFDKHLAAAKLSMDPATFSRSLKKLEALGVHSKGTEITIDDFSRLSVYCCIHCSLSPGECCRAGQATGHCNGCRSVH